MLRHFITLLCLLCYGTAQAAPALFSPEIMNEQSAILNPSQTDFVLEDLPPNEHQKGEEVAEKSLTFFGKGIQNRRTKESLLIACVGDPVSSQTAERKCDQLQFVLITQDLKATWYSDPFTFTSKEEFNKRMKRLEQDARPQIFATSMSEIAGCGIAFGGAGVLMVVSTGGVAAVFFGFATLLALNSKHGWKALDFITPLPSLAIDKIAIQPILATANQDGWNWAIHPDKIRNGKFENLKYVLSHYDDQLFH